MAHAGTHPQQPEQPEQQQLISTWASIKPDSVTNILAQQHCKLSQEGCSVIQWISMYFTMDKPTRTYMLVHAMLLWNAFIEKCVLHALTNPHIASDSHDDHILSFLLFPIACFHIACKLFGGYQCVQTKNSFLVKSAVEISVIHYNSKRTQYTKEVCTQAQVDLCGAELLVLQTFDWNVSMVEEIDAVLKSLGVDLIVLPIVKQAC